MWESVGEVVHDHMTKSHVFLCVSLCLRTHFTNIYQLFFCPFRWEKWLSEQELGIPLPGQLGSDNIPAG